MSVCCVEADPACSGLCFLLTADGTSGEIQKVAVGIDIRSGQALPDLQNVLEWMSINGICYEILFLDASDDVLVKRYKETRRTHPLAGL